MGHTAFGGIPLPVSHELYLINRFCPFNCKPTTANCKFKDPAGFRVGRVFRMNTSAEDRTSGKLCSDAGLI